MTDQHESRDVSVSQIRVIVIISVIWIGVFVAGSAVIFSAPFVESRHIDHIFVLTALKKLATFWIPIMSSLCAYWFTDSVYGKQKQRRIEKVRAIAAIVLTGLYGGFAVCSVVWVTYFADITDPAPGWTESLGDFIDLLLLFSFVATVPIVWLTGSKPKVRAFRTKVNSND